MYCGHWNHRHKEWIYSKWRLLTLRMLIKLAAFIFFQFLCLGCLLLCFFLFQLRYAYLSLINYKKKKNTLLHYVGLLIFFWILHSQKLDLCNFTTEIIAYFLLRNFETKLRQIKQWNWIKSNFTYGGNEVKYVTLTINKTISSKEKCAQI